MRTALAAIAAALLLAGSAFAQQPAPAAETQLSTGERLAHDPAVRQSQDPQPSPQGTRPPDAGFTDTSRPQLQALLDRIWLSPVDLEGNPMTGTDAAATRPSPAAATATGCNATSHDLAERPPGSPAPCPPAQP
jgi:hypothetical protein